jgi:hypothetical protein
MAKEAQLSTYVTTPEGEERVKAYKDAQANLRQALDSRQNQLFDPTLLAISQALGSPTRTGSFGEVLGNVAGAVGTAQEAEMKRSREIAGMKLELAKNELQSHQLGEGQRLARDILSGKRPQAPQAAKPPEGIQSPEDAILAQTPGARPAETSQPSTGGGLNHITGEHLAALAMSGQKELADVIAKGVEMDRNRFKVADGVIVDLGAQGGPKMIADLRVGEQKPTEIVVGGKSLIVMMNPSEQRDFLTASAQGKGDEFYKKNFEGRRTDVNRPAAGGALREIYVPLLGDIRFQGTDRQAAEIERLSEEAIRTRNPTELRNYVNSITQRMPERPAQPAPAQSPMDRPPAVAGRQPPAVAGRPTTQPAAQAAQTETDLSGLPLADQNKAVYERLTKADAPAQETAAILQTTATPQAVSSSNRRLKEIGDLVKDNPEVVGLMNKQGVWEAIKTAAAEGIKVGPYQVSAPVKEMLQKSNLTADQQTIARRLDMLFNEEFFNRAALAKSALGPQISNADSILMRSPMAGTQDSAKLISYWSLHGQLVNRQNDEMYKAYNQWFDQTKGKAPARQFFNKEGRVIMEKYNPYFERLQDRFEAR